VHGVTQGLRDPSVKKPDSMETQSRIASLSTSQMPPLHTPPAIVRDMQNPQAGGCAT
jgi:hypothetical protein